MTKTLPAIASVVRGYVADTSADVDQPIVDTINFLSNFFYNKKIDSSKTTTAGQDYITLPELSEQVLRLEIAGEEILPLLDLDDLSRVVENGVRRWYESDNMIMLTFTPTSAENVKIWYNSRFITPTSSIETDVPDDLMELVFAGAVMRYWRYIVSQIATNRENFPDINPDEARKTLKNAQEHFDDLFKFYLLK